MTTFLSTYWLGILLIGGMLFMHLGHRGNGAHSGGCGQGHASLTGDDKPAVDLSKTRARLTTPRTARAPGTATKRR